MRRWAIAIGAALGLALAGSASASADVFGTISLLSATPFTQAEDAHDPAISGDGRYVVFDGAIGGVSGVWRRENRPGGAVQQVAGGDAQLPSVGQDGRYVSFTTDQGARLAELTNGIAQPKDPREAPGVYVRDMDVEPGEAAAFTLASAANGSSQSLTYEQNESNEGGAMAAGRTALSSDGRKVVFVTTAVSNLAGPGTPPLQVALRNLDTDETQLVSVRYDPATGRPATDPETGAPEPVANVTEGGSFGAVYSSGKPPQFSATESYEVPHEVAASISGDGSTVSWLAQNIAEQAPTLSGETLSARYDEPLWRRIGDGEQAPTRRVTGGSDPTNPACAAHPEAHLPSSPSLSDPCQGPFVAELGTWNAKEPAILAPCLSADGDTVAFIASAEPVQLAGGFGRGDVERESDVYVVDMHEGLSRTAALRALSELAAGSEEDLAATAEIVDVGVSPDGTQVAFTTRRTQFPLGSLAYVTAPAAVPGLLEVFDVDLANDTLTRVTHGYEGGAAEHPHSEATSEDPYLFSTDGALSPSFSQSGNLLAFSSTASNLVFGDGNTPPLNVREPARRDGGDVFVIPRTVFTETPTPQVISPAPPNPSSSPSWTLGVTAVSLKNGNVVLYVLAPGAGQLAARASAPMKVRASVSRRRGAHPRGRRARTVVRTLASAGRHASGGEEGPLTLTLPLAATYRANAEQPGGISATVAITFGAAGHPALRQTIPVTFRRAKPPHRARTAKAKRGRYHKRGGGR